MKRAANRSERGQRAVDEIGGRARLPPSTSPARNVADAAGPIETLDILVNNAGLSVDLNH